MRATLRSQPLFGTYVTQAELVALSGGQSGQSGQSGEQGQEQGQGQGQGQGGAEDAQNCAICYSDWASPLQLPCKHIFCEDCIVECTQMGFSFIIFTPFCNIGRTVIDYSVIYFTASFLRPICSISFFLSQSPFPSRCCFLCFLAPPPASPTTIHPPRARAGLDKEKTCPLCRAPVPYAQTQLNSVSHAFVLVEIF